MLNNTIQIIRDTLGVRQSVTATVLLFLTMALCINPIGTIKSFA